MVAQKVVLITGSSLGIGAATARAFAAKGATVVITYNLDKSAAEEVAKDCRRSTKEVLVLHLDVTDTKSITACVKKVVQKFKRIDVLVNNAGVIRWKKTRDQTFDDVAAQIRVNLEGLICMTLVALPYVKHTIINIASTAGKNPHATLAPYCATKFGVRGFTQTLALEEKKLTIYSVNPGVTATRMTDFEGVPPEVVADVIVNAASGKYRLPSGSDIDVSEYAK